MLANVDSTNIAYVIQEFYQNVWFPRRREGEIGLLTFTGLWKEKTSFSKIFISVIDCAKVFDCVEHTKLGQL